MNDVVLDPFLALVARNLIAHAIKDKEVIKVSEEKGSMFHFVNLGKTIISEIDRQTVKKETVNG